VQIFRVIVRGRFGPLEPAQRERLVATADDHDLVSSDATFTAGGTLAYDGRIDFFSYRVEVRVGDDDAHGPAAARDVAFERATAIAAADLERRGLPCRHLEPTGTNMADVWK
jgi:hypothetical protein